MQRKVKKLEGKYDEYQKIYGKDGIFIQRIQGSDISLLSEIVMKHNLIDQ